MRVGGEVLGLRVRVRVMLGLRDVGVGVSNHRMSRARALKDPCAPLTSPNISLFVSCSFVLSDFILGLELELEVG